MCGIVGYIGTKNASSILLNGLQRLEYRGYDSAGVAVLDGIGIELRRSVGKLPALVDSLRENPIEGTCGLGHTRWATHGRPTELNAHPHTCCLNKVAVVHNGILENYIELKTRLQEAGHSFKSETDTEVFAHLIEDAYIETNDLKSAVQAALKQTEGSYALGVVSTDDPNRVIAARKDSPLVLGIGEGEMLLASDVPALLPYTRRVIYLNDGELAELTPERIRLFDAKGHPISREPQTIQWDADMAQKSGYDHFMLKEIHEQRETIQNTFGSHVSRENMRVNLESILPMAVAEATKRICLVGCGTSYHAALVAKFWFEELAGLPCDVEIASEFRYRRSQKEPGTLVVPISQSGETADTLAALKKCKEAGLSSMAICNVLGSSVTRYADYTLFTRCGPEIGVASTKAFTGQLTALFVLSLYLAQTRGMVTHKSIPPLLDALAQLPAAVNTVLEQSERIREIAGALTNANQMLYLGRHLNYPIALEGALKMKEISYLHAEGYPGGEMKHGPIALLNENYPVVGIVTQSSVREKMLSNLEEVKARGGRVIAIITEGDTEAEKKADYSISIPAIHELLAPILTVIPLQLLAYNVAKMRNCDVDQPRNLAKSVTVE